MITSHELSAKCFVNDPLSETLEVSSINQFSWSKGSSNKLWASHYRCYLFLSSVTQSILVK